MTALTIVLFAVVDIAGFVLGFVIGAVIDVEIGGEPE